MKKVINFFPVTLLFLLLLASCTSNDKTESATTETDMPDTSTIMVVTDTSGMVTMDTSANATTKNTSTTATKAKKGKISAVMMTKSNTNSPMNQDKQGYYSSVEVLPTFPGGKDALDNFISNTIEYPENANENGIEGVVNVYFAVDETGRVSNPKIIGKALGYGLEEEVLKAVNKMPTWTPGAIKGKNVKTYYTLPVNFKIEQ